jgi:hypothetical protein
MSLAMREQELNSAITEILIKLGGWNEQDEWVTYRNEWI